MAYSKEYWGEDGLGPVSDDVALRTSRQRGYANSDQSSQDEAYAKRVEALEAEKKRQAAAAEAAAAEAAAMQNAVAQDAAAAAVKVAAAPVVALPKATQNNEQQDRNSLGRQYLLKSLALNSERPDMAAMNEYARQRSQGGDLDMLNSFAAAYAGERYAPNQASHLKRAMAARDPLEVSGGMLTNKGFVEDPYAAREQKGKAALAIAKELNDSEQLAKREVAADARLRQRFDPDRVGGAEAQQSARRILSVYGPQSDAAQKALSSIPSMREALKASPDGIFGPTLSAFAKVGAEFGIGSAERAAAASQIADAISKQFGIAKLSEIGGNDTDKELITSIATTYNGSNLREVNNQLLTLFETISQKNIRKFNEAQLHARQYGSILRGPEGKTFDDVFDEKERARFGQNNLTATPEGAPAVQEFGAPPPGAVRPKVK